MSQTVVISGAAPVAEDERAPTPLLSVAGAVELAVFDAGSGPALVVHNRAAQALAATVQEADDLFVAGQESGTVPLPGTPEGPRLHLLIVCAAPPLAVTAVVSIEASADGAIAVGQAIGRPLP